MLDKKKIETVGRISVAIIALVVGYIWYLYKTTPQHSRNAHITDFEVCGFSYTDDGLPDAVNLCGVIKIDDDASTLKLNIVLYKMPNKKVVSSISQQDNVFEEGFFSQELRLDGGTGSYLVEIWLYRGRIGSVEFDVKKERE